MLAKIQRWGNSQALRLPKTILRRAHLAMGDEVELTVRNGQILVRRSEVIRGKYKLEDLVGRIPKGHRAKEEDWGRPVGRETW